MVALLLYYKKFVKSLKSKGFKLNPYDPCVANKQVDGEQLTVCFHVDDCKILHISPKVVSNTIDWLRSDYENVSVSRRPVLQLEVREDRDKSD